MSAALLSIFMNEPVMESSIDHRISSKCFLCGNPTTNLQLRTTLNNTQLLEDWKRSWAMSLCDILGLDLGNYKSIFQSASYCACCQESICTADFTLKTIEKFQSNLSTLRSDITERLVHHYVEIKRDNQDPLGVPDEDNKSIENIIETIKNVKPKIEDGDCVSGYAEAELFDGQFSDHQNILPPLLPLTPLKQEQEQRLLKLKRRLPLTHVQLSSLPIRSHSRKQKSKKSVRQRSDVGKTRALSSPPPRLFGINDVSTILTDYSNNEQTPTTTSPSKISRSGRVIKPVRRFQEASDVDEEISDSDADAGDSDFDPGQEDHGLHHLTDDESEFTSKSKDSAVRESGTKRQVSPKNLNSPRKKLHFSKIADEPGPPAKTFPCTVCKKPFPSESKMEAHLTGHRLQDAKSFKCSICYKLFPLATNCNRHENLHEGKAPFSCVICQETLTGGAELIHHVQMEHDSKGYWCNFTEDCLQKHVAFRNQQEMRNHLGTEHGLGGKELEFLHHCTRCELRFKAKTPLQTHLLKTHQILDAKAKVFPCPICSKTFLGKQKLRIHQEGVHSTLKRNPKCSICTKTFPTVEGVADHELLHNLANPFDCVLCVEKPKNTSQLHIHVAKTHEIWPFKCLEPGCEARGFETAANLKYHRYLNHFTIEEAKCCDKCPFKTRKLYKLQEHMLKHGEKTFVCKVEKCGASYHTQPGLLAHFHNKHDESRRSRFPCKLCPKAFATNHKLADHELYHTDLRPYLCEICSATFKTTNTLQHHMRVHDPNKKTGNNWKLQRPRKPRLPKLSAAVGTMGTATATTAAETSVGETQRIKETGAPFSAGIGADEDEIPWF